MTTLTRPTIRPSTSAIVRGWVAAVLLGDAAAMAASLILRPIVDPDLTFQPLQPGSVVSLTVLGAIGAAVVYSIVVRRSARPRTRFLQIAAIALVLSFGPDLGLLLNTAATPFVDVTPSKVLALMVLHVVAAPIIVAAFLRLAPPLAAPDSKR